MTIFICPFCGKEKPSKKSVTSHKVFCTNNPNCKTPITLAARLAIFSTRIVCVWCNEKFTIGNIKKHQNSCKKNPEVIERLEKICPVCSGTFMSSSKTCSYSCSNTYFRHKREGGTRYLDDTKLTSDGKYRDICFRHHDKKCVICDERNIVSVHHLNENHEDHRPENLIPLCPTHHLYCHSNYKHLVSHKIEEYVEMWKSANKD